MKTQPCCTEKKEPAPAPKLLTWLEILEKEGVYRRFDSAGLAVIVVTRNPEGGVCCLFYNSTSGALQPACHYWSAYRDYIRVENAVVHFEIR